ncbi:MAG: hypothetical protein HWN65_14015 [Candidatus Helarchaeota archaeon]|nr:hypothetical protein [Candidatus Helarchaeota archaeon]
MPRGFIVTKWDEDEGLVLETKFPETIEVDLDDQMRVFYSHITGTGTAGNVVVRLDKSKANVASYFTGMESETPRLINLMLELGEDPEMFGDIMIQDINQAISNYLKRMDQNPSQRFEILDDLKNFLSMTIFYLERFANLSKEQRMAQIYASLKGLQILQLLRERARSRKEIQHHLEQIGQIVTNIEIVLDPFIKTGIVKQDWIEDVNDIFLFLLTDFTLLRKPAVKIIEQAKKYQPAPEVAEKYLEAVRRLFSNYKPSVEDSLKIAKNMLNPDKFDIIGLFKDKIYPIKKIPKGTGQTSTDIVELIKTMAEDDIFIIIKDKQNVEWVLLLSELAAESFYPEYLIEKIRKDHLEEKLNQEVAVKHLELLEKAYTK